ncbi:hypothetical protein [Nocardia asteroides]|uniref:hypothetical protein n=1 Tax=Nocardia asteroides TaxID=1824 RepID=UPI001E64640A|nr:hypothetical protein [Nocardia asteroides]UGT58900.1 hypothetical protein LTT85_32960 [Nocardia asteroides]
MSIAIALVAASSNPTTHLLAQEMPAEVTEPLMQQLRWLMWFTLLACVVAIVLAGGRLGWAYKRGELAEVGVAVPVALGCGITISVAASIALSVT